MYKKHKKNQNTDPAFNSYLLLNGFKKNEKKKDLLLRVDTLKYKDAQDTLNINLHHLKYAKMCKN